MCSNFFRFTTQREISALALHRVRVEDILEEGLDLRFSDPKEEWNRYIQEIPNRHFSIRESVETTARLRVVGRFIQVQGSVKTELDLGCCRCLERFSCPLISRFDLALYRETDVGLDEETELEKDDLETDSFSGDEIDLSELFREQIVLNIPYKPLCHEACRGLCSGCGANLNAGTCACDQSGRESPFDVLKKLKLNQD
jgi:uncharacterized protein